MYDLCALLAQTVQSVPSTVNEYGVWIVSAIFVPAIGVLYCRQIEQEKRQALQQAKQEERQEKQQERQDKQHEECLQEREKLHAFLAEQIAKYAETRIAESKQHADNFMVMAEKLAKVMHQSNTDWSKVDDWMERTNDLLKTAQGEIVTMRNELMTLLKELRLQSGRP